MQTIKKPLFNITAGMLGHIVEQHDKALFGFLAPFIGMLFFENSDPLTALIRTYVVLFLGTLSRPLGALAFGFFTDRYGRKRALVWSLFGMTLATFAMGCLPTYSTAGILAPLFLALARIIQSFFAAGEANSAALFVLEHAKKKHQSLVCSLLETSTIVGILLASAEVALFSYLGILQSHWRYLLWFGGCLGLIGLLIRRYASESEDFDMLSKRPEPPLRIAPFFKQVFSDVRGVGSITLAAGFSNVTYIMAIPFMAAFLTVVSPLTATEVTSMNTGLLILDMFLLPLFGYLATRVAVEKVMFMTACITVAVSLPLFYLLEGGSLLSAIAVRSAIVILGVSFAAPFRLWAKELIPLERRCTGLSLGCALGSILFEGPIPIISLWLYQVTGISALAGLTLAVSALLAALAVKINQQTTELVTHLSMQPSNSR